MKKVILHITIVLLLVAGWGCDVRDNDFDPRQRFTRVYDDEQLSNSYYPLDVTQTSDGGYLMMGIQNERTPYFLKVDEFGMKVWESTLASPYEFPAPGLLFNGSSYFFFCKSDNGLNQTYLMEVDPTSGAISEAGFFEDYTYPLKAMTLGDGSHVLLGYDAQDRASQLIRFSSNFSVQWDNEFDAFDDSFGGYLLDLHLRRQGTRIPFFLGYDETTTGGISTIFFNGYSNFTISTTFVDPSTGSRTGGIFGNQDDAGLSSGMSLGNGMYAISTFDATGATFYQPSVSADPSEFVQFTSFETEAAETQVPFRGEVLVKPLDVDGVATTAYLTTTRAGKIELKLYDSTSGEFKGTRDFGYNQLFQAGQMTQTSDGGLAIFGFTSVESSIDRLLLIKISKEDLSILIQ